jgi:hypothetical protein
LINLAEAGGDRANLGAAVLREHVIFGFAHALADELARKVDIRLIAKYDGDDR